jgi:hypothetical protein
MVDERPNVGILPRDRIVEEARRDPLAEVTVDRGEPVVDSRIADDGGLAFAIPFGTNLQLVDGNDPSLFR